MSTISLGNVQNVGQVETIKYIDETGEIVVVYTNGSEFTIQQEAEPNTPTIDSHELDGDDLYAIFSNGDSVFVATLQDIGLKTVNSVFYSNSTNSIIVSYHDGTSDEFNDIENIPRAKIVNTFLDESNMLLYATYDDGTTEAVANVSFLKEKSLHGDIVEMNINDKNELEITTTTGSFNLGDVGPTKIINGEDADPAPRITDLNINNTTGLLEATFSDGSVIEVGKAQNVTLEGMDIAFADAHINDDGNLIITTETEGQGTQTIDVGRVKGRDGIDGTIFESANVTHDGEVSFKSKDGTKFIAGKIDVNPIVDAYVEGKDLVLLREKGDSFHIEGVVGIDGKDGVGIEDITYDGTTIKFEMSDDSEYVIEDIGVSIVDVTLNDEGKLEIDFSDGNKKITDVVKGRDGFGRGVKDIEYKDGEFVLSLRPYLSFNDYNKYFSGRNLSSKDIAEIMKLLPPEQANDLSMAYANLWRPYANYDITVGDWFGRNSWCQEMRGYSPWDEPYAVQRGCESVDYATVRRIEDVNDSYAWRPVLELI